MRLADIFYRQNFSPWLYFRYRLFSSVLLRKMSRFQELIPLGISFSIPFVRRRNYGNSHTLFVLQVFLKYFLKNVSYPLHSLFHFYVVLNGYTYQLASFFFYINHFLFSIFNYLISRLCDFRSHILILFSGIFSRFLTMLR